MTEKSSPSTTQPSNFVALILTFFAINGLFIYLIFARNIWFGSKAGHWDYPYFNKIDPIPLWIPVVVLVLLGCSIYIGSRLIRTREILVLLAWYPVAVVIQFLMRSIYPHILGDIVGSDMANSFYSTAMKYTPLEILSQFNNLAVSFPLHARTNMPGKILLFQLFKPFTISPHVMAYLIVLFSILGGLSLYYIVKMLFHDKQAAFYALILYALIPGKLSFYPILNTITPLFILLSLFLLLVFIERKQVLYLLLFGASIYLLVLFEPTPLVTGVIFIGILIHSFGENKLTKKDFWALLVYPTLAFIGIYLFFLLFFSFDLLRAFLYVLNDAVIFNVNKQRDYWIWIGENPKEFFLSAGIPIMILFIYLTSRLISQIHIIKYHLTRWSMENILILSLGVTFLVVLFLGINRGEVTRLWIYLAVFFQIPAAYFLTKIEYSKVVFFFVTGTLVVQSLLTIQRVGFVLP